MSSQPQWTKVDRWKNSSQRHRWLATALVDIEPRLRQVMGYRHLPKLREALQRELKIERKTPKTQAAGMSLALLKLSGDSVHDYATISDDSPSPSCASRARSAATS